MTWREYHELTKHSVESLRRTQHYLDWANMPNPFRHYEGVPVFDFPADPPAPQISALEVLEGKTAKNSAEDGAGFLSQLMFYSASISNADSVLRPQLGGLQRSVTRILQRTRMLRKSSKQNQNVTASSSRTGQK